ncbi:MAG: PA14 domain-containing protein [Bacillota bacterium]
MRTQFTRSAKKQTSRNRIAPALRLEPLESRQLLSSYFVSPTGNDSGNGSITAPWKTVQHAVDSVASGDVVNLRGGNYGGNIYIGTPNITLQSYNGEKAYISSSAQDTSIAGTITIGADASGTKLLNLDVSGGGYYTIKTESTVGSGEPNEHGASNILIQGCKLHGSGRVVVKNTPGRDNVSLINYDIYDSGMRDASNAEGIDNVNGDRMILRDSYIHDIATTGVYAKGGSIGSIIERNRISNTGGQGIILGQDSDPEWFDLQANPQTYENIDGVVRNNIVTNTAYAGIAAWAALRPKIFNNTLINVATQGQGGILLNSQDHYAPPDYSTYTTVPTVDATVSNNIVVTSAPMIDIRSLQGSLTMNNNVFYNPRGAAQFQDDTKNFYGDFAAWKALRGTDGASVEANPQLTSDGHLNSNSPAINRGQTISSFTDDFDAQKRPAGAAWDIGADESGATGTVTLPPTDTGSGDTSGNTGGDTTTPIVSGPWENHSIANQTGTFSADFDIKATEAGSDIVVGFSNGTADAYTDLGPMFQFNGDDSGIYARNGGAYAAQSPMKYAVGTTYHVKMVVRTQDHTYDVFVTPQGGSTVQLAQNYAFRSEQSSVSSLNNWVKATYSGAGTVSNFALNATAPTTATNGLKAQYFDSLGFQNLKVSRVDPTVNFNWGTGAPATGMGADSFNARWTGYVVPKYSETYTFYTKSDDGVRLWVNGKLLIDNWTNHSATENKGTIALQAGQKYAIKMEYYENTGNATATLGWSSTSQAKQIIPQSQLFTA